MKKLTLNVDALRVESFDAATPRPGAGTVLANENLAASISYCSPCFFTQQANCTREDC